MADDIGFSGTGSPDIRPSGRGGKDITLPEFFDRSLKVNQDEENVGMDSPASTRERALAQDSIGDPMESRSKAPRIS